MAGNTVMARLGENRMLALPVAFAVVATAGAALGIHWLVTVIALAAWSVLATIQAPIVVAVVVLSIPVQSELALPFVRGEITFTQLVLFGLIAGWAVLFWRRRVWLDSIVIGFLLVLAAYTVSFIEVDDPGLWFQETYRWAVAGIFYVICRSVITSWQHVRMILWSVTAGVVFVSVIALVQMAGEIGPGDFLVGGAVRVYATFGTPNTLAAYLEMTVPVLLACIPLAWWGPATERFSKVEKWLVALVPMGGLLVLGLTQSRGGWVGIAVGCLVLWAQLPGRTRIITALAAVVLVGGFLLTTPGRSQLDRFASVVEETNRETYEESRSTYDADIGRGSLWGAAQNMLLDKPLTGIGAGEFDENYREYVPSWIDRFPRGQAHNVWLQMGAQAGIWGIIAFAWWWSASIWSIFTARRRVADRSHFWIITGVLAVFVAFSLHSLVDYLNVLSLGLQLSVLTAIALNLAPEPLTRYSQEATPSVATISPEALSCPQ